MFIDPVAAIENTRAHQTIFMLILKQATGTDSVSEILSEKSHLKLKYPCKAKKQDLLDYVYKSRLSYVTSAGVEFTQLRNYSSLYNF